MEKITAWKVLGLNPGAGRLEIKKAYRQLVFEVHPDTNPRPDEREKFYYLKSAYEILQCPIRCDLLGHLPLFPAKALIHKPIHGEHLIEVYA